MKLARHLALALGLILPASPVAAQILDLGSRTVLQQTGIARVSETFGEIEMAMSTDGQHVIVAVNNLLGNAPFSGDTVFFSTDGAQTFSPSTLAARLRNRRDPTMARGGSGDFYYAALQGSNAVVGRSTDGGANFSFLTNNAARCADDTNAIAGSCTSDQPHIAADPRSGMNADQLYIVWRESDQFPGTNGGTVRRETQMIQCSTDNGQTWGNGTTTGASTAVGRGILARVATGPDGRVYVVFADRRSGGGQIFLQRFSSCADGLSPAFSDTPSRLVTSFTNVPCPVPGLDRCNSGNILSSPTVAVDQANPNHVYVTFAHRDREGNEQITVIASTDGGATFDVPAEAISGPETARRFMPWSCGGRGEIFIGWYDRRSATVQVTDNTEYFTRSVRIVQNRLLPQSLALRRSNELNLSGGVPDPQCANGWAHAPRNIGDSENCSVQPQLAGVCTDNGAVRCARASQCGAGRTCQAGFCVLDSRPTTDPLRCDFSNPRCLANEACSLGRGAPTYGDYNGLACSGRSAALAWASNTPPAGAPPTSNFAVYAAVVEGDRAPTGLGICQRNPELCNLRPKVSQGLIELVCDRPDCLVIDHVPENCKRKFKCPGCELTGRCPPIYSISMKGLDDAWKVSLVNGAGKPVRHELKQSAGVTELRFEPAKNEFVEGLIGDYYLVFTMTPGGKVKKTYPVSISLERR